MKQIALYVLITVSISANGQKIGFKYGWNYSLIVDQGAKNGKSTPGQYLGIEYEFTTRKPWTVDSKFNEQGEEQRLDRLFFVVELALIQVKFNEVEITNDKPGILASQHFTYIRFSPRLKVWDSPKKDYSCRVIACCDFDDYGKFRPYFNLYVGPKLDFLIKEQDNSEIKSDKIVSGAIVSLNTQFVCMNSGSIYTDIQFISDFNKTSFGQNERVINTSFVLTIGFKIRNSNNY
jgi:hypothetical protein